MANPQRGEVALTVGDQAYTLVLDLSAICELEGVFSTPKQIVTFPEIVAAVLRLSYRHIRGFVWAALRKHHPDVTLAQAGTLIEAAGGVDAFFETILALHQSTQPDAEDAADRPRKARPVSGTGAPSTSTPAGSVSRPTRSGR